MEKESQGISCVSWSGWSSLSKSGTCRSECRRLDAGRSRRGKRPTKGCPAGSHHRPEGHQSHSGSGRKERSNKYTNGKAATWGFRVLMRKGGGRVGLELDWDKAEVGVGLRWDGVGMKLEIGWR